MIKHVWSILCEKTIINQEDNIISIIGVLEQLNSTLTPVGSKLNKIEKITIPFSFEILSYWIKSIPKEIKMYVKTTIFDPDGKELSSIINESVFPSNLKKLRSRLKVQGLQVTKNGNYTFKISLKTDDDKDYKLVSELPLEVNFRIEEIKMNSKH